MDHIDEEDYLSIAEQLALEGHQRALAKVLTLQLQQKFGDLGTAVPERVRAASIEELELWMTRILPGHSIDDVLNA